MSHTFPPSSHPSDNSNRSHLLPVPENYTAPASPNPQRRKRGLSLRAHILSFTEPRSSNTDPNVPAFELSDWSDPAPKHSSKLNAPLDSSSSSSSTPPTTRSSPSTGSSKKSSYPAVHEKYLGSNISGLSSVPSSTINLNTESVSFEERRRAARKARFGAFDTPFLRPLVFLRERILKRSTRTGTLYGRQIPCCTNHSRVNAFYDDTYYDESTSEFVDERTDGPYVDNKITSSKYTLASFLPKQLKAQFSRVANCYFLIVALMQMIPGWSTTGHYTTIIPLLVFTSISIIREGIDDLRRHGHDKEENSKSTRVIKDNEGLSMLDTLSIQTILNESLRRPSYDFTLNSVDDPEALQQYNLKECHIDWASVKVGDIVVVKQDEWIPADLLLLATSNSDATSGEAFVETMALDGETNLKSKFPPPHFQNLANAHALKAANFMVTVEDPNDDLYNFEGSYSINGITYLLGPDNVLYRGCALRNTPFIVGLVIFSGEETKIRMNNIRSPRIKAPKLQRNINFIVVFMVVVVIVLATFSTALQRTLFARNRLKTWYLLDQDVGIAATFMGFVIMYNTLIPLSLYVTMEIIKVMQLCFLQHDIDMYDPVSDTPAAAKTATILEELGQVSHIFTDKTGTLTDNVMIFRKFTVGGVSWLHDLDLLAKSRQEMDLELEDELENIFPHRTPVRGASLSVKATIQRASLLKITPKRHSTTSIMRHSLDAIDTALPASPKWNSTAQPFKKQEETNTIYLLKYVQRYPLTVFSTKVKFFLLCVALCNTCAPKKLTASDSGDDNSEDSNIDYQAASPDELALVRAARDLGLVVLSRRNNSVTIKSYPHGFNRPAKLEVYSVLDIIEFSSARKRMSVVVEFPDGRICLICKGADNVIIDRLKKADVAQSKARDIAMNASDRKQVEANIMLQLKKSQELETRKSVGSLRPSFSPTSPRIMSSIDNALMSEEAIASVVSNARSSLHAQQARHYSIDSPKQNAKRQNQAPDFASTIPNDALVNNDEYVIEKTLEHVEEFSTEGLRTLMYGFRWLTRGEYDEWLSEYSQAKVALHDRAVQVENVGGKVEHDLDLLGATAIEDKLQDGVSDAIDKLRRAGIKMWMLTGDKRETAINIGYSCRLIKDYSQVFIISNEAGGGSKLLDTVASITSQIQSGRVVHSVLVIDGGTLAEIQADHATLPLFIDLCDMADSTVCCRASPSQKASMVSAMRERQKSAVTLAIGDGANDIAMIQSADIGIGITGKEGLQAARLADYSIAQFRFLLKLLLVNGRYNYMRTTKFVLCTFYKEVLFYLTQCTYQRNTLFSGSSMYESWSLSMFNTLFTSLAVICVGMFDKDLKPSTLLAVPELYATGRLYRAFNLRIFIYWMMLAALQSVAVSFMAYKVWGELALRDNTTFPLGSLCFAALCILINAKCVFIEMHNRQWLAFASFILSIGGLALWNVLIMQLYKPKQSPIFFVATGLFTWGQDRSWWALLLVLFAVPMMYDILLKLFMFMARPSDDEVFRVLEKDLEMRRLFEQQSLLELKQGWTFQKERSTTLTMIKGIFYKLFGGSSPSLGATNDLAYELDSAQDLSAAMRKRAGTDPNPLELPPSGDGEAVVGKDFKQHPYDYEVLPSGKKIRTTALRNRGWSFGKRRSEEMEEDVDKIIDNRLKGLDNLGESQGKA